MSEFNQTKIIKRLKNRDEVLRKLTFSFLLFFRNGEFEKNYGGDRSVEDIVNFMKT